MQDHSKTRAVVPGKAILGEKAAAEAAARTLGGSVVPGRAILGDAAEQEQAKLDKARKVAAEQKDPKAKAGAAPKTNAKDKPEKPLTPAQQKAKDKADAKTKKMQGIAPSYTEDEVKSMLEADPNDWERVLELENQRPEFRLVVANMVLEAAANAKDNVVPDEVIAAMQLIVTAAADDEDV